MKKVSKPLILALALVALIVAALVVYELFADEIISMTSPLGGETDETAASDTAAGDSHGTPAADFTVYDASGNAVSLSDNFGKPLVVNFWASWCDPCKAEMPYFQTAYESYGDSINFMMVNLTDGARETVESADFFLDGTSYTFPVYYDSNLSAAITYGINSIPMTLFIDSSGVIKTAYTGAISENLLNTFLLNLK